MGKRNIYNEKKTKCTETASLSGSSERQKRIDLKIDFACNNRCQFCVQGDKRYTVKKKTTKQLKELISSNKDQFDSIVFTGGEPTIHKDFLVLVECAAANGYRTIQIQSNGRMFSHKQFCEDAIKAGITEVSPSVHGNTSELHDYLTRSQGSFAQTILGIKNLRELDLRVLTNTVITKSNFRELPEIAKLLIALDVTQFQLAFVHPTGTAEQDFFSIVPRKTLAVPCVHTSLDIANDSGVLSYTEGIPYCFMKGYEKHISEVLIPDTKIVASDVVIENFTRKRVVEGKKKSEACEVCARFDQCEGPWKEYVENYGWDEFVPI